MQAHEAAKSTYSAGPQSHKASSQQMATASFGWATGPAGFAHFGIVFPQSTLRLAKQLGPKT